MGDAVERGSGVIPSTALAVAAVAFVLALGLPLAYTLNIWQDEAYTLDSTGGGLAYALQQAIGFEQNAPLYFIVIAFLRRFAESVFFLRAFSVVCIAATVALVPVLVRRYVPRAGAGLVASVVACNPFIIWSAIEIRAYALIILLSALLLLTFYDAFMRERPSGWVALAYAICVALALYTQYYLAFIVASEAFCVLLWYRPQVWRFAAAAIAGCLAFVPLVAAIPNQVENFRSGFESPGISHAFVTMVAIIWHYLLPLSFPGDDLIYGVITLAFIMALVYYRPSLAPASGGAIVFVAGCAAVLLFLGTYAAGVHVLNRHAAGLYLPATLGAFGVITSLQPALRVRAEMVVAAAAVVLSLLSLCFTYRALATPGDWIRVESYLRAHERPGEPIVVFEAENALPLAYYYRGPNAIVPIPRGVDFRRYDVMNFVIRDESELKSVVPQSKRIWLVTAGECTSGNVGFGCSTLDHFVAGHYRTLADSEFYGSRVRLLERFRPPLSS